MALRSDAVLSKMILEAEMRDIGITNAKLNPEQEKFLKAVTDRESHDGKGFKDFFLHGKYIFSFSISLNFCSTYLYVHMSNQIFSNNGYF